MADKDDDDFSFGDVGEDFSDSDGEGWGVLEEEAPPGGEGWGTLDDEVDFGVADPEASAEKEVDSSEKEVDSSEKEVDSSEKEVVSPPVTAPVAEQEIVEEEDNRPRRSRGRLLLIGLLGLVLGAAGFYYLSDSPPPVEKRLPEAVNRQPIPIPARVPAEEPQSSQAPAPPPEGTVAAVPKGTLIEVLPEEEPGQEPLPQVTAEPAVIAEPSALPAEKPDAKVDPGPVVKDGIVLKEVAVEKPLPAVSKTPQKVAAGKYTVQVGAFANRLNREEAAEQVRALGFTPVVTPVVKTMPMVRLLIGVFDPVEAKGRVRDLAEAAPDAFYLRRGDSYAVYAASFYDLEKARALEADLRQRGITVTEEPAEVEITLSRLSFGVFSDRKSAESAISKARSAGLEAQLVIRQ